MLNIDNLTKRYGKFLAVNNLNMHIDKGEIFGFVGPNGAGKTTTMKIICGLLDATSGSVTVDGVDALKNPDDIKRKVGYVPDFFGVYDNLKTMEYMEFFGSMYGMDKKDVDDIADGLLELVNLSDKKDVFVDTLSRGMKQRLCVARALIHNPDLLVLDEPNSGLDPRARFEMKEVLKNLSSMGKTIIISSHILPELSEMCTSIGIMDRGQLVTSGHVDEIMGKSGGGMKIHIRIAGQDRKPLYEGALHEEALHEEKNITAEENADNLSEQEATEKTVNLDDKESLNSEAEKDDTAAQNTDYETSREKLQRILSEQPGVTKVSFTEDEILVSFSGNEMDSAMLLRKLVEGGINVSGFYKEKEDLESLFLEITGGGSVNE